MQAFAGVRPGHAPTDQCPGYFVDSLRRSPVTKTDGRLSLDREMIPHCRAQQKDRTRRVVNNKARDMPDRLGPDLISRSICVARADDHQAGSPFGGEIHDL